MSKNLSNYVVQHVVGASLQQEIFTACLADNDEDIVLVRDSYVIEDSMLNVARWVKELFNGRIVGVDNACVYVIYEGGAVSLQFQESSARLQDTIKAVLDIGHYTHPDKVDEISKLFEDRFTRYDVPRSSVKLWYTKTTGELNSHVFLMDDFGDAIPEYYPWVRQNFFDEYLDSSSSILFLSGVPGTGKTSYLRHEIAKRGLSVCATYDEKVMNNDRMFISFITSVDQTLLIVEEADNVLLDRQRGQNDMISRFLNFSDGLVKFDHKKLVFTTNVTDFAQVDPAILRPGRCFGHLEARKLTYEEALVAAKAGNLPLPKVEREYTIAELTNGRAQANKKFGIHHRRSRFVPSYDDDDYIT